MAARIQSSRSSWALRFCTVRMFGISRKSMALDKSHGAQEVSDVEGFALRAAAWLKDAHAREAVITAGQATVAALGGSLERTLAALEPHLMRIRLEERERHA